MKISSIFFLAVSVLSAVPASAVAGTIEGTVVNTSTGAAVPCQVAVILQVPVKGEFIPCRDVVSGEDGRFRFDHLPVGDGLVYRAGATRHGIFYPGQRIRLTALEASARTALSVCDAAASPNPLVLKTMDIVIRPETGLLRVTESLLLENPSHTCYVGQAAQAGADPVTLELSIPPDFERTTFAQEFFGRRFAVFNKKVVTSVPWPPGERELRYTYVLRTTGQQLSWQRPLDLPCSNVTVRVEGTSPDEVRCGLLGRTAADEKSATFASAGREFPAGQVLQVEFGRLPLPWMTYGKWVAVAVMFGLIAAAGWLHFRRGRRQLPGETSPKVQTEKLRKKAA